jgi:hypothetical protein
MWSFLKRHIWLSVIFAILLYAFNRFFPADDVGKSWWWTLVLPNAMIAFIAHRESHRAKADHNIVIDAISERLPNGGLTEADRNLALRFYDLLRHKLCNSAVREGSFKPGESLYLILRGGGAKEVQGVLAKLRVAPSDVPELTPEEERLLAGFAGNDVPYARVIIQWLFASGGELAVERLQNEGVLGADDATISDFILELLPQLPSEKYSEAVRYLSWRREYLKGRTGVLPALRERLLTCTGEDFENTVSVLGGINCGQGTAALRACWKEIRKKHQRDRIDREIAELIGVTTTC